MYTMRVIRTAVVICLLVFGLWTHSIFAQDKKKTESAPIPTALLKAKKVFITNGGGNDELYDIFYSQMKSWARYELVGSPEEADLVFAFSFGSQGEAPEVYTNPANLRTYSYTTDKVRVVVYDTKTHFALWSATEAPKFDRKKYHTKAVEKIMEKLKHQIEPEK